MDDNLLAKLHPLERKVFPLLEGEMLFDDIVKKSELQDVEVMRALQWLANKKIIKIQEEVKEIVCLDANGEKYRKHGLPEKAFLKALKKDPLTVEEIGKQSGLNKNELSVSLGILKKKGAIELKKENKTLYIKITDNGWNMQEVDSLEDKFLKKHFPVEKSQLKPEEMYAYDELSKRSKILKTELKKLKFAYLTDLGKELSVKGIPDTEEKLTPDMLKTGAWKEKIFRRYDVEVNVPAIVGGKRHITKQAIEYIKRIWFDLGFKEMDGTFVQTSFWDLDALFVPQDHPARDMQDTFYIREPQHGNLPDKALVKRVKDTHETGWNTGSAGWGGKWSEEKASENLLRTHTTVLSARTIAGLKKEDLPAKYFAVSKVFRNETIDWKHLFEFVQVEGIVVDPDVTLRQLIGYVKEFFRRMGYPDARVRPGHFPYTEPSAEVEIFHPKRKEWVEFGGAGVFRPEVVKPLMGFDCPVLAWGLTLERAIPEYWAITDIRDLYKNDIKKLREYKIWLGDIHGS